MRWKKKKIMVNVNPPVLRETKKKRKRERDRQTAGQSSTIQLWLSNTPTTTGFVLTKKGVISVVLVKGIFHIPHSLDSFLLFYYFFYFLIICPHKGRKKEY